MSGSPTPDSVETLTVLLGALELTITVRNRNPLDRSRVPSLSLGASSSATSAAAGVAVAPAWEPEGGPAAFPRSLIERALAAETAPQFAPLNLAHLGPVASRLTAGHAVWSPAARLGRAFKAGVVARLRLDGEYRGEASPSVPFRNSYYVVLRGRENGPGFWTTSYQAYISRVSDPSTSSGLASTSISHAFASFAECAAFVSGAQVAWPQEI
jgi:hypothetical protein